jgi:hypothetical protein
MKLTWKRGLVFVCALAVVIAAGVYSSDHLLKATDGEENIVETDDSGVTADTVPEDLELPQEEEAVVAIEQGVFENETLDAQDTPEETTEAQDVSEEATEAPEEAAQEAESDKSVVIAYEVVGDDVGVGSQIKLTAVQTGYENPSYQWQYNDGNNWIDIDGATSSVYMLTVTKENSSYRWRVDVEEE